MNNINSQAMYLLALLFISLPASAVIIEYDMVFADTPAPTATGGTGVLTVDLPGTAGSDTCMTVFGCGSPPAFSVLVSFQGTVNGVTFSIADQLRVLESNSIVYSATDLVSGKFNLITASEGAIRTLFNLTNGSGTGRWDFVSALGGISGFGDFTIARATSTPQPPITTPEPGTLALLGLGIIGGLGYARKRKA